MAEKNFNTRMQQKIDTTENWGKAVNFVPKKGEIIVYSDGGGTGIPKIKVGDGTTKVGELKFSAAASYTLPSATTETLGGIKIGTGLTATADGTTSVASAPKLATARDITIGSKTQSFDGSAGLVYSLADIGAASTSSLNNYMPLSGGMFTGGVQFSAKTNPLSWTIGDSSTTTLSILPNNKTATESYSLTLPQKTGELAVCSKSDSYALAADGWDSEGKFTLTLSEAIDSVNHTVIVSSDPNMITSSESYSIYAAAQIVPTFESETTLVLKAYGTVPTDSIYIIITQID